MKSFFLSTTGDSTSYSPAQHLALAYKFVLVEEPGAELVLIIGSRDFDWHYQIVEEALTRGMIPSTMSDRWVSGGKIKHQEIVWHSSVYGDVPIGHRAAITAALGIV